MFNEEKNYRRVQDICNYTKNYWVAAHIICNLRYKTLKEMTDLS